MGRLGGGELGYGSDADVLFVHDPVEGADERRGPGAALEPSSRSCAGCSSRAGPDPALELDADLRPEGKNGPLVRTLDSLRSLLRALVAGLGGAGAAAGRAGGRRRRARRARSSQLVDPLRWPRGRARRRPRSARSAGSRRGSRPSGCPAAPTRAATSSSAAAASPTSSGPSSCSSCSTPTRSRACARRGTLPALAAARGRRPARREDAAALRRGLDAGLAAAQRRGALAGTAGRQRARRPAGRRRHGPDPRREPGSGAELAGAYRRAARTRARSPSSTFTVQRREVRSAHGHRQGRLRHGALVRRGAPRAGVPPRLRRRDVVHVGRLHRAHHGGRVVFAWTGSALATAATFAVSLVPSILGRAPALTALRPDGPTGLPGRQPPDPGGAGRCPHPRRQRHHGPWCWCSSLVAVLEFVGGRP